MLTGVIFCDSDNFVADQIKAVTQSDISHVALLFNDIVLHFRFLGFESIHIEDFRNMYHIQHVLAPKQAIMVSPEAVIRRYRGKAYDFKGIMYLWLFFSLQHLGIILPGHNKFEVQRDRFCVEFASEVCLGKSGSNWSPHQFLEILVKSGWLDVTIDFI